MNKPINFIDIEEISTQLKRAEFQKNNLIKNIYKEYEIYLQLVRRLLFESFKKGIYSICFDLSKNDISLNYKELSEFIDTKLVNILNSHLPLITVEQLKIKRNLDNSKETLGFNRLREVFVTQKLKEDKFEFENDLISEDSFQFSCDEDISNTLYYNKLPTCDEFISVDLDNIDHTYFSDNTLTLKKSRNENQFLTSLIELSDQSNMSIYLKKGEPIDNSQDNTMLNKNLDCFDLIDNSLANLLMSISYKVNLELSTRNFINNTIPEDTFKYLINKNCLIKHPYPFVINFDLSTNQLLILDMKLPNIYLLNISTVELEFKNLELAIVRNKIKNIKNHFKLLLKKENYWKQKKNYFNKLN